MPNQATKAKQLQKTMDELRWLHHCMFSDGRVTNPQDQLNMYAMRLAWRMTEAELKTWEELTIKRIALLEGGEHVLRLHLNETID